MNIQIANIAMEISCVFFLLTLFAALLYKREETRSLFYIRLIMGAVLVMVLTDLLFRLVSLNRPVGVLLALDYAVSYCAKVFMVCSFTWYFYARFEEKGKLHIGKKTRWGVLLYSILISVLFILSFWTGWFFYIDDNGVLIDTEHFTWVIYLFVPLVLYAFLIILKHRRRLGATDTALLLLYCILPVAALALDVRYSTVAAHLALTLDACMLYTLVDAEQEQWLSRTRQDLAEMHLNSMVSQINPHFIYNTLGSIESLMVDRPEKARELLAEFSDYLGDNYVDLTKEPMISFQKELEHVEHYLSIETVRFPNLKVVYDIQTADFEVPCLSIQPLAENAVKHGVCRKKRSEGTLVIASEETEDAYLVRVEDDGAGFDTDASPETERTHVGIENVTRRLDLLCDGTLTIRSTPGVGTTCEIRIPKGGDKR